jgi:hypothetical protein
MSLALYLARVRSSEVLDGMLLDPMSRFFENPRTIVAAKVMHFTVATTKRLAATTGPHLGIPTFGANEKDDITHVSCADEASDRLKRCGVHIANDLNALRFDACEVVRDLRNLLVADGILQREQR